MVVQERGRCCRGSAVGKQLLGSLAPQIRMIFLRFSKRGVVGVIFDPKSYLQGIFGVFFFTHLEKLSQQKLFLDGSPKWLKRPNIYIFEKQGYQIWHFHVSHLNCKNTQIQEYNVLKRPNMCSLSSPDDKIYGLYGLEDHMVEINGDVTMRTDGQTNKWI